MYVYIFICTYNNRLISKFLSLTVIIENYEFTQISPIPIQYHEIHSSFHPFFICNFLLQEWETSLSVIYLFSQPIPLYITSFQLLLPQNPPAFCVDALLHRSSYLSSCWLWPLASKEAAAQSQTWPSVPVSSLLQATEHPNYPSGLCFFPLWFSIKSF